MRPIKNTAPPVIAANLKDLSWLFILGSIWGGSFMLMRIGVETIPPFTLTAFRLLVAALMIGGVLWCTRRPFLVDKVYLKFALLIGLVGNALPFTLISWAEKTINASQAAILMGFMPLIMPVLAHFFANERFTKQKVFGLILGFLGLLSLVGVSAFESSAGTLTAQLAVICATLSYACMSIMTRRIPVQYTGSTLAFGTCLAGGLIMLPLVVLKEQPWNLLISGHSLIAAIILGLVCTGIATLIYFPLVRKIGASNFAQINYIVPMMGVFWGYFFLHEVPGWNTLLALILVLSGIALVHKTRV